MRDSFKILWKSVLEAQSLLKSILPMTFLSSALLSVKPFVLIYLSGWVVTSLSKKAEAADLMRGILLALCLYLVVHLCASYFALTRERLRRKLSYNKDMRISKKVMSLDYEAIESPKTHHLKRQIDESENMSGGNIECVTDGLHGFFMDLLTLVVATLMVFQGAGQGYSLSLALVFAVGIFVLIGLGLLAQQKVHKLFQGAYGEVIESNRIVGFYFDYVSNYKTGKSIRLYDQSPLIAGFMSNFTKKISDLLVGIHKKSIKHIVTSGFLITLSTLSVYLFVGVHAVSGAIDAGHVVRSIGSITLLVSACTSMMKNISVNLSYVPYLKLYFDFMALTPSQPQGTLPTEKRDDNAYEIAFHNVSFKYPGAADYALEDVSLKLRVGERLAIVGMNGSGKTTLIKLLCRLYDPSSGHITLNGIDIKKYNLAEYQSLFAVIFQDFHLMSFSVAENVATHKAFDEEKIKDLLDRVGFTHDLNTPLYRNFDENGVTISGGEAQKVALARAMYQEAPIVILDEPTAALDPIAEYEVYRQFGEIVGSKTTFYISHRLSSCRFCDNIAVFDGGKLIELGSHDALVNQKQSKYHELWHAQANFYGVGSFNTLVTSA